MAKLIANTTVTKEPGQPVILHAGDELPEWAEELVGAHLLDESIEDAEEQDDVEEEDAAEETSDIDFTKPAPRKTTSRTRKK